MIDTVDISKAHIRQFTDNLQIRYQQEASRLRGTTLERTVSGPLDYWNRIGSAEAAEIVVRHGYTPEMKTPLSNRRCDLSPWVSSDLIDRQDVSRVLIEPHSAYTQASRAAMGRAFDSVLIEAFDADVRCEGTDEPATSTFASEGIELTGSFEPWRRTMLVKDLLYFKGALDDNAVPEENRHIVMPPAGFTQLLNDPNITNSDYAEVKALVEGQIDEFCGFTFHRVAGLLPILGPYRTACFCWHRDAMGVSVSADIATEIVQLPERHHAWRVACGGYFGAVRIQGEGVLRFAIDEDK